MMMNMKKALSDFGTLKSKFIEVSIFVCFAV